MYVPHLLYPVLCELLGCFHVLAVINSAAVNIGIHVSFWTYVFLQIYDQEWDCRVIW